jgi:hypothetical protein
VVVVNAVNTPASTCSSYSATISGFFDDTDAGGDTTPPVITDASANPSTLWPPNHKMVNVTINYGDSDACGGPVSCSLSVSSNEGSSADWQVVDAHHVKLRADRNGNGNGRVYTITITCSDIEGNVSTSQVQVMVPHDQGH